MTLGRRLWIEWATVPLMGGIVGALVLGAGGRLSMAGLMLMRAQQPAFTLGGTMDVVAVGALYGLVGGVLLIPLRRLVESRKLRRGVTLGLLLLIVGWLTSPTGREMSSVLGSLIPAAIGLASVTFVVYGVVLDALVDRVLARRDRTGGVA